MLIKQINFDEKLIGIYSEDQIKLDWNNPKRIMGANRNRCQITKDPLNLSKHALEIKYPKGKVGQEDEGGGAQ